MSPEIKAIIAAVACCVTSFILYLINFKRKNRKKQRSFPYIATFYGVLFIVVFLIQKANIIDSVNKLGLLPGEELTTSSYLYTIEYIKGTDIALFNLLLIVSYIIVKCISLLLVKIFTKKDNVETKETSSYYYDNDEMLWFLKDEWVNFRSLLKWMSVGITILTSVFLFLTCYLGNESPLWVHIFLALPLIIVYEITNYYNGFTKKEFFHNVYGIDAYSQRINNYHKLRALYELLFPNEILAATTSNEHANQESGNEIIEEIKKSDNSIERITGEFFENNDSNNYEADSLIASIDLVEEKNVVFYNPFYRDLSDYVALPLINVLLSTEKCLVISGRNSLSKDIKEWLKNIIKSYTKMESLWRIETLSHVTPDCEIGILNSSNLYDLTVLKNNFDFFSEVKFVIFIEPSMIINTAQISLSIIAQKINENGRNANFCVFDKQTDGLVDTLSHVMKQEIVNVVAPPIPRGAYTAIAWNADGDYLRQNLFEKQTKYFGNGIELSAVAIKNQVPKVTWYSESKAPVRDIKWIASQYYPTLCKYMNLPSQQKSLQEKIIFESSLWSASREKDNFIIAEDEFNNLFITMRAFLTRGLNQTFVNVLSENYLLRDYMRCNSRMFLSNPNAIPSLVPDYAKTERNIIIKLILMMSIDEVEEKEIVKQLKLINLPTDNVLRTLYELITRYTDADEQILEVRSVESELGELDTYTFYSVKKETFEQYFADTLKTAYYIVENEEGQKEFLDSKLYGHITQSVLPDQYLTYNGKYYVVKYISSNSGVVLRRASDLYSENQYYRQLRKYRIENINTILTTKEVVDIEFSVLQVDFNVETDGYIVLKSNNDLRSAKVIRFSLDNDKDRYNRSYKNKNILRVKLPGTDDKMRFTISMLLSELFRSVYPTSWQYIAAVSMIPNDIDGMLNHMIYQLDGDEEDEYIYIFEDSYIDLGLLSSIEKNIYRFFEILSDFLEWHEEKMHEPERKDPIPKGINSLNADEEKKRRSLFTSMAQRIRNLFVREKEETVDIPPADLDEVQSDDSKKTDTQTKTIDEKVSASSDYTLEKEEASKDELEEITDEIADGNYSLENDVDEEIITETSDDSVRKFSDNDFVPENENADLASVDGTDIFANDGTYDDYLLELKFQELGLTPIVKTKYQKECFLKFGFEEIDDRIKIDEVKRYFRVHGWCNNNLTKARQRDMLGETFIDFNSENHCDFCGLPLTGISFDKLSDGRIRCNDCSSNTISTVDEMSQLFYQVLDMMGNIYGINYKKPISIEMADARTVGKKAGILFKPSSDIAERVLGFAKLEKGKYSLVIENGSPKLAAIDTMVHEMTHIWQYINWSESQLSSIYQMPNKDCPEKSSCDKLASLIVYEGMAVWSSIQYLYQMGENYYASKQEAYAESRNDVYGIGFRLYKEKYPLIKDGSMIKYTPFLEFPTIEPMDVIEEIKKVCTNKEHNC